MSDYVLVLYYSKMGATGKMAEWIGQGIESVSGMQARIRTVPPVGITYDPATTAVPTSGAPYVTMDDVAQCAGIALGSPTRFGNMAAPLKHFIDNTTALWFAGALTGKPAGVFTSTSSMHGGQEATLLSMALVLLHHGALIVGLPYREAALTMTQSGGTPYGPSHLAGIKSDNPLTEEEISLCKCLGVRLARAALALKQSMPI